MYNSLCRDSQDTKALCFPEAANIHNSIIVGKVPFTSRRESLADYLDNSSACGGHFVMNSGIYKITNTVTGDFYIGSAVDLRRRFGEHRCALVGNRHINTHLQRSWNKYGADSFTFETVLYCDKEHLLEREQFYIDNDKPSYNICLIAGSNLGRKFSDEVKQHMSEAHKGERNYWFGKHITEETKQKISEAKMGEQGHFFGKHHSEETKQQISEANMGERHPMFGKHLTEEHKQHISEAQKGELGNMFGKHHSNETKSKMSETKKGKPNTWQLGKHPSEETKRRMSESASQRQAKIRAQTTSMLEIESAYHGL